MRVDVIDRCVQPFHRHLHAAHRAFARGLHHVMAVRGRAIAGHFGINFRAAFLGALHFFQHQNAGPTGNHKTVAVFVIGAAGRRRCVIIIGAHCAHRVKQD